MAKRQYGYNGGRGANGRVRLKPAVLVVLVAVVAAIIIFFAVRAFGGSIASTTIEFVREDVKVVVIRDESVVDVAAFGKAVYSVDEGSDVIAGQQVAEVYKWGHDENNLKDLMNIQRQIYAHQTDVKLIGIKDSGLDEIQSRINSKNREISLSIQTKNKTELIRLSRELESLLQERYDYLRANIQVDPTLAQHYESEAQVKEQLNSRKEAIIASTSGRVSFNIDDYARVLNGASIDKITVSDVDAAIGNKAISYVRDPEKAAMYKIISPEKWYIAIATNRRDNYYMAVNNLYNLEFSGFYDNVYSGKVVRASRESNRSIYILEVNSDVHEMIDVRTAAVKITGNFTGYSIPKKGVTFRDDQPAINLSNVDGLIPIEIISESDDDYIFRSDTMTIQPGTRFETPTES